MAFTYGTVNKCTSADGTANNIYEVRLGYELQSQDLVNNTSTFKLQLEARSTDNRYKPYGYNQTTTIDGTTYSAKTFDFRSTNTWQVFGTKTLTDVSHNTDGTYSVSKSGSFTTSLTGARPKNGSASVTVTLPTIPRKSSITVTDANIGSTASIIINRASNSFTTTLYYKASGQDSFTKIVDKTSEPVWGWTVPTSFYSLISSQRYITCQFYAETWSGNTLIGTSDTVTATFKANVYPTINSITAQTIDQKTYDLTGNRNTIIKGISGLQVSINATAGTGANISSYVIGGVSTTSNPKTITQASSNSYSVSVYDSRGEPPTTTSFTMPNAMINYVPLALNATIVRNQPTDGKIKISYSGNYFNGSFGAEPNTLTVQYRSREKNGSWGSWTNLSPTVSGNTYSQSNYVISGYDYTKQYEFQIKAIDKIYTRTIEGIDITKGKPIFYWDNSGLSVNGTLTNNDINMTDVVGRFDLGTQNNKNANDYIKNSIAYFGSGSSNVPANWTYILTMGNGGTDTGQFGIKVGGSAYYRSRINNNWESWTELAKKSDIPTNNNQLTNGRGFTTFDCDIGTSGIWSYAKFSNGLAICYAREEKTISVSNSFGDIKTSASQTVNDFPFNFTAIPIVSRWIDGANSGIPMNSGAVAASVSNAGGYQVARGTTVTNGNFIINTIAIGRWK